MGIPFSSMARGRLLQCSSAVPLHCDHPRTLPDSVSNVATSTSLIPQPAAVGPAAFNNFDVLDTSPARESATQEIVNMSFERPDVERATNSTFNNPNLAAEHPIDVYHPLSSLTKMLWTDEGTWDIPTHLQQEFSPRSSDARQGVPPLATQLPQHPQQPTQSQQSTAQPASPTAPTSTADQPIGLFKTAAHAISPSPVLEEYIAVQTLPTFPFDL